MSYLRCFLMEVLRCYPAFPAMMRSPNRAVTVADLTIPAGKQIMVSPYAINHNTDLWGADAADFCVERWEKEYNGGAKTSQAFMTFSSGSRVCIGKEFAVLSLKVMLYVLVERFVFEEAVPGVHPVIQKGTSLKPMDLRVKVRLVEGQ
jgi:cytochrome P450